MLLIQIKNRQELTVGELVISISLILLPLGCPCCIAKQPPDHYGQGLLTMQNCTGYTGPTTAPNPIPIRFIRIIAYM